MKSPNWYTDIEGGVMKDWPDDLKFDPNWLKLRCDTPVRWNYVLVRTVKMGRLDVHSVGWDEDRWNCVNGWNA